MLQHLKCQITLNIKTHVKIYELSQKLNIIESLNAKNYITRKKVKAHKWMKCHKRLNVTKDDMLHKIKCFKN